jgi:succinyl-diaminopimelate desuccinylase
VEDDKGPSLLFLFALKELKESNVKFNKKIRFFIGCDEENDWQDVDYIRTKTTLPEYGFSPDGNFPVTYAEKGVYKIKIKLPNLNNFKYLPCGTALNAVCDYAELKILNEKINLPLEKFSLTIENDKVVSHGLSAHGSMPENGKNAIKPLLLLLKECGEKDLNEFISLFDSDTFLFYSEQGKVTLSPNLITEFGKNFFLECDVRVPAPLTVNLVKEVLDKKGFEYEIVEKLPPVMVEKDGWFINSLLSAYKSVTGKKNAKAEAMGGSTFGRAFSKGCSFGVSEKGMSDNIHGDNEWISQDWLKKCFEIYKQALYNIVK